MVSSFSYLFFFKQSYDKLIFEGKNLCSGGNFDLGYAAIEKAIVMKPNDPRAHAMKGGCYYLQEKYLDAMLELSKSVDLRRSANLPSIGTYEFQLAFGHSLCVVGKKPQGISNLKIALDYKPNDPKVLQLIQECSQMLDSNQIEDISANTTS